MFSLRQFASRFFPRRYFPAVGDSGAPSSDLDDTFTDTAGTAITAHTSDSGHTWDYRLRSPGSAAQTLTAGGRLASSGLVISASDYVPTDDDYEAEILVDPRTTIDDSACGVVMGLDDSSGFTRGLTAYLNRASAEGPSRFYSTYYLAQSPGTSAFATIASRKQGLTLLTSNPYPMRVGRRGTFAYIRVNGTIRVWGTTSVTAKGRIGVFTSATTSDSLGYLPTRIRYFALPAARTKRFWWIGDSLALGTASSGTGDPPGYLISLLNASADEWEGYSLGLPAVTAEDVRDGQVPAVLAASTTGITSDVAVVTCGSNDLYAGATAAEAYEHVAACCSPLKAAGKRVVVETVMPRTAGSPPADFETQRLALNVLIRSGYRDFAHAVADSGAHASLQNPANTTYFVDQVHNTDAGNAIRAGLARMALWTATNTPSRSHVYRTSPRSNYARTVARRNSFLVRG